VSVNFIHRKLIHHGRAPSIIWIQSFIGQLAFLDVVVEEEIRKLVPRLPGSLITTVLKEM
jgi:hypothetical protein